jgi:hypothetical protein
MANRNNVKKTYLTDAEAAQLSEWADEADKSESHLIREAIMEYLDHDRTARIEEQLDRIESKIDTLPSLGDDDEHTHTSAPGKGSDTVEKARRIARRLYGNHEPPIKRIDVERAIEDIAGADDRTLKKYKGLLKKRGLLYQHPTSSVWTDDREQWIGWVEGATVGGDVHECIQDYPITTDEYADLVESLEVRHV